MSAASLEGAGLTFSLLARAGLVALPITLGQLQRLRIIGQLPVDLDLLTGKKKVLIL